MKNNKQNKEHLANFHIAGFTYYDGAEAFSELKMGTELNIALDEENKYDARAVMLVTKIGNWATCPGSTTGFFTSC